MKQYLVEIINCSIILTDPVTDLKKVYTELTSVTPGSVQLGPANNCSIFAAQQLVGASKDLCEFFKDFIENCSNGNCSTGTDGSGGTDTAEPTLKCQCAPLIFESDPGQVITPSVLLAASGFATFPDGSVGGATGVNWVEGAVLPKGITTKNNTTVTDELILSTVVSENPIGFAPGSTFFLGSSSSFAPVPNFVVTPSEAAVTKWAFTVYKCDEVTED